MGQRAKRKPRCPRCFLHLEDCLCGEIRRMHTRTHVALVMHRREVKKSTNTGRLINLTFENSSLHVRGLDDGPADLSALEDPMRRALLLFPREDALPLTPELLAADPRPVTLIVPDGTWSQARRVVRREPALIAAQAVLPVDDAPTRYRLRNEPLQGGLATAEAVARALGVLEGPQAQEALEQVFDLMVERTLATRKSQPTPSLQPPNRPRPPTAG